MLAGRQLEFEDYLAILRRQRRLLIILATLGLGVGYLLARVLPKRYTSKTLVLVQEPTVSESYVKPVVTADDLDQRLASMQEQILSRTRLQHIIEKFGLYKEDINRRPMEELVERLRKLITITPLKPMAETRSRSLPGFDVSVTASTAKLAQEICVEVTKMYMEQNLHLHQQQAEDTTQFLTNQLNQAKSELDAQDAKLAAFKSRHIGQLPDNEQTNMNLITGLIPQLEAATQALNRAEQDKAFTQSLLSQQLTTWKASQEGKDPRTLEEQLNKLQTDLATLRTHDTDDHPDVVRTRNDIAQLKKEIAAAAAKEGGDQSEPQNAKVPVAEPPQIQQLRAQLHQYELAIRQKSDEQNQLQKQLKDMQARIQLSPVVEQEFKALTRDHQTALDFYNDLLKKRNQSEMATDLERRQEGEQFRVLDPPSLPEKPSFPNRLIFSLGGFAGGLALGAGFALVLEWRDKSLRTERDIELWLRVPTLALIPSMEPSVGKALRTVRAATAKRNLTTLTISS